MKRNRTKKRARSQARNRKSAVVIPAIPELKEHADAIRRIGENWRRQSFEDAVEIGRRLDICRRLLKAQREWLAWIKLEFGWSRAHADNLIGLYLNRGKLLKFSSLPISALYLLAKAPPKLIGKIARDIKAGGRPLVREIQRQTRAERVLITRTSSTEPSGTQHVINISAPAEEPTEQPVLTPDNLQGAEAEHQAAGLPERFTAFDRYLSDLLPPDVIAAALSAEKRPTTLEVADAIITKLNELKRALWETGKPKLVS